MKFSRSPKILVRSPNWVGDAIMATGVPRALKRMWPDSHISILAKAWAAPVWQEHPDVNRIITWPDRRQGIWGWWRLVFALRQEKYDLALIMPNSFSSAWLTFLAGCRERVGYATEGRDFLLSKPVPWTPGLNHVPRPKVYTGLTCHAGLDVDLCQDWGFVLKLTAEENAQANAMLPKPKSGGRIGLAPGSVAVSRRWPAERYAQLADLFAAAGHTVVLVGSREDEAIAQRVKKLAKTAPVVLAGRTDLRQGLAVIRNLDLLVSNDSGAMHMAYAQNVPVLVLQGAADPQVTGPFGSQSAYLRDPDLACAPCVKNECQQQQLACMLNLTVDQVWAKAQAMLQKAEKKNA